MVSAPVQSIDGPFVPASADQPLDVGLHQQLQDAFGHSTQKVTVASLLQKLIQWQSLLGHRGFSGQSEVEQLHPRPPAAVTTPVPLPDRRAFPPPIPPKITPRPWTLPCLSPNRVCFGDAFALLGGPLLRLPAIPRRDDFVGPIVKFGTRHDVEQRLLRA